MGAWILALMTLASLEIVLGIDNIILLTILVAKLPKEQQKLARQLGLGAALISRILLLFTLSWLASLTAPVFELTQLGVPQAWLLPEVQEVPIKNKQNVAVERPISKEEAERRFKEINEVSWRDIILILGGVFLVYKSTKEIHAKVTTHEEGSKLKGKETFASVITQIAFVDIVFSLDSVITAVGMVNDLSVMVVAILLAVAVMLFAAGPVGDFVERNPSLKILALSFLIMIGVMLIADGFGQHLNRGYVYFAMAFSFIVEMLNLRVRKVQKTQTHPAH